jgi:TPR repeat protein
MLAPLDMSDSYRLNLVTIEGRSFSLIGTINDSARLKELKRRFGLTGSNDEMIYPLDIHAVTDYLRAADNNSPIHFKRVTEQDPGWGEFVQRRQQGRDRFGYELAGRIREAEFTGAQPPGPEQLASIEILHGYNDPWATYMLALMHLRGWFVPKDEALARTLTEQAIAAGYTRAATALGFMALQGIGQPMDLDAARHHFQRAADAGSPAAHSNLAALDLQSQDMSAFYRALSHLETAASAGEPWAAEQLALRYLNGDGVAQNDALARTLFAVAAEYSFRDSAFHLGYLRSTGRGGETDPNGAVEAYQKAAALGSTAATYNLGLLYSNGQGVAKDAGKAAALFQQAASAGSTMAMGMLAYSLEFGEGVAQNEAQAAEWYERCAQAGEAYCQWRLGVMIAEGRGRPRDDERAQALLEQAVESGEERAKALLAQLKEGVGRPPSATQPPSESGGGTMAFDSAPFRRPHLIGPLAAGRGLRVDDEVMGYLSGLLEIYLPNCPWLKSDAQLASTAQFYQAATQRALTNMFDFSNLVQDTVAFASAANDGKADATRLIETYGCERSPLSEALATGIVETVAVVGSSHRASRFVTSCAETRLNDQQCTCLAELGRGVDPNIDETFYDPGTTIKSIVNSNPILGLTIAIQCGIGDY